MLCFFKNFLFPYKSRFLIAMFIIIQPVPAGDPNSGFFHSFVNGNILPVIYISGTNPPFYSFIRTDAQKGNRCR